MVTVQLILRAVCVSVSNDGVMWLNTSYMDFTMRVATEICYQYSVLNRGPYEPIERETPEVGCWICGFAWLQSAIPALAEFIFMLLHTDTHVVVFIK